MEIEYSKEYVTSYYPQEHMQHMSPMDDVLNRKGREGWNLCAVSSRDSGDVVVCYFSRVKKIFNKESSSSKPIQSTEKEFNFCKHQNKPNKQWYEVTDRGYFEAGWDAAVSWMSFHAIAKMLEENNGETCKKT